MTDESMNPRLQAPTGTDDNDARQEAWDRFQKSETPADMQSPKRAENDQSVFEAVMAPYRDKGDKTPQADTQGFEDKPLEEQPEKAQETEKKDEPAAEEKAPTRKKGEDFLRLKQRVPQGALESLTDDQISEWVSQVREREASVDRTFAERAELKAELDKLKEAAENREPREPARDLDLDSAVGSLADELALDGDAKDALSKFADAITAPLLERVSQTESDTQARQQQSEQAAIATARQGLGERFPGLEDSDVFEEVHQTMQVLSGKAKYGKLGSFEKAVSVLMEDAARASGLQETDKKAEESHLEEEALERKERAETRVEPTARRGSVPGLNVDPMEAKRNSDWDVYKKVRAKYDSPMGNRPTIQR